MPPSLIQQITSKLGFSAKLPVKPMSRKEFYDLAKTCRAYANELAGYDQTRVNLKQCYKFNQWLPGVQAYELLQPATATIKPARPVARWQVLILAVLVVLLLMLGVNRYLSQTTMTMLLYGLSLSLILFTFFVPERLYGTTTELLEGKVLRIVEAMERALKAEDLGFTEGAYFQVKEDLAVARRELRQQIDLAHRRWR